MLAQSEELYSTHTINFFQKFRVSLIRIIKIVLCPVVFCQFRVSNVSTKPFPLRQLNYKQFHSLFTLRYSQ